MLVTASWGGVDVAVEVDAECRSVAALKRCLQEELPKVDVEAVRLEVCGRPLDDEAVLGLVEGCVIDVSATQAALAVTTLREEGRAVDFKAFCHSAEDGDVRLCNLYLEAGVVWPRTKKKVANPLHIAARRNHTELCELLLESGCETDAQDKGGNTALHHAVNKNNLRLTKLLLSGCATDEKTTSSACRPHSCAMAVRNKLGNTPLHLAVYNDNARTSKLLLDAGCEKDVKNSFDNTPLHVAVYQNNQRLVQLLSDSGCATDVKNSFGETATTIGTHCRKRHQLLPNGGSGVSPVDAIPAERLSNGRPSHEQLPNQEARRKERIRQVQVSAGKATTGYENYCRLVPRHLRLPSVHLDTPPTSPTTIATMSRPEFYGEVDSWRMYLSQYDDVSPPFVAKAGSTYAGTTRFFFQYAGSDW